jgi:hypothetical protein
VTLRGGGDALIGRKASSAAIGIVKAPQKHSEDP